MDEDPAADRGSSALSSVVYERLRSAIIACQYPAGERLRERELGIELEVSRVPIREALPRLETAGFVRMEPRKGAIVTFITAEDVEELYDLRSVIEPLVARTAARRVAGGADPTVLRDTLAQAGLALSSADAAGLDAANAHLHREILRLSGSRLLEKTLAPLTDRTDRLSAATIHSDPEVRHSEHRLLVDAIVDGADEVAQAIAFAHAEFGRSRTLAALPSHPHFAASRVR
ncbi:GntR family transcriptional regulator [Microbacteriaceae bacterium VKM Ac-2855]|nr:GntR family transcriptional regulator [Microbacteriaceae bacterium VKM Ac-2855]